jgi:hypothetical protein
MLESFALEGFALIAGLSGAVLVGFFGAQYVSDVVKGVPTPVRTALSATESWALAELKSLQTTVANGVTAAYTAIKNAVDSGATGAAAVAAAPSVAAAAPVVAAAAPAPAPIVVTVTAAAAATGATGTHEHHEGASGHPHPESASGATGGATA